MKILSLLLLCILSAIQGIQAQWTSDTTLNTLVRDTAGATVPLVAPGPDGSTYISWFENGGSDFDLRMQRLDSNGYNMWGPAGILVSNFPQNSALYRYDLVADNEGNAIVAFQDERTGSLNVAAYKIDLNGNLLWGPSGITLLDSLATQGLAPVIGITAQNDVVIAWSASSGSDKWIAAKRFSPSGTPQWSSVYRTRDTTTGLKYSRPELLPHGNNNVQMLFVEESGSFPGVTSTLYLQHIDAAGNNILPSAIKVSTKTIPFFVFPQPVADNSGGFYVAFNTSNPLNITLNDVYVQHVDSSGNLWSATGTEAANSTVNAKIIASSCYIPSMNECWVLMKIEGGGNYGVSVQKIDSAGNVLLGPDGLFVVPLNATNYIPATINDAGNGVILTTAFGNFGNEHIIAAKLDYSGTTVWANTFVSLSAVNSNKDDIQSRAMFNDNLVIVWKDDRNGSGIFTQNITGAGGLGFVTGIAGTKISEDVFLYPNPSEYPILHFGETNLRNVLVVIFDAGGKVVYSENARVANGKYRIDPCIFLPNGIYTIAVNIGEKTRVVKWIK